MFLRAGQSMAQGKIAGAFGAVSPEEIARAMSVEQQRVDELTRNAIGQQGTLTTIGDAFTGQNTKTNEQLAVLLEQLRVQNAANTLGAFQEPIPIPADNDVFDQMNETLRRMLEQQEQRSAREEATASQQAQP